jgi:hypothetical protein
MVPGKSIGKESGSNFEDNQVKEAPNILINSELNSYADVLEESLLNGFLVKTSKQQSEKNN